MQGEGAAGTERLTGEPLRASGSLALHVLEVIAAIDASSDRSEVVTIASSVERPAAV